MCASKRKWSNTGHTQEAMGDHLAHTPILCKAVTHYAPPLATCNHGYQLQVCETPYPSAVAPPQKTEAQTKARRQVDARTIEARLSA